MRVPSPMNDSAGFVANGEVSSSNVTTQNFGLPLNGRSVSQLSRLAPGVGAGAQVGGVMGASSAAQPSAADVKAGPVKVAKEKADESDEAVRANNRVWSMEAPSRRRRRSADAFLARLLGPETRERSAGL